MTHLLILGGTRDAVTLAEKLAARWGETVSVTTSLAGRTRDPVRPPGGLRVGGFGGAAGFRTYLREYGIAAVIGATHPFAAQISHNAASACAVEEVPLLRLQRPPWRAQPGDDWRCAASNEAAAAILPDLGTTVFLTVGSSDLHTYFGLTSQRFLVRAIEPDALPELPDAWTAVFDRGPFDDAAELALMRTHGIEVLVTKNSGGGAVAAKLRAARTLGLPVVMIDRPPGPAVETVSDVEAALNWVRRRLPPS